MLSSNDIILNRFHSAHKLLNMVTTFFYFSPVSPVVAISLADTVNFELPVIYIASKTESIHCRLSLLFLVTQYGRYKQSTPDQ